LIEFVTYQTAEDSVAKFVALRLADGIFFVVAKRNEIVSFVSTWRARSRYQLLFVTPARLIES
jgi:hypothetical protein